MEQGTKLGGDEQDVSKVLEDYAHKDEVKATKLGEISEFEKSLMDTDPVTQTADDPDSTTVEDSQPPTDDSVDFSSEENVQKSVAPIEKTSDVSFEQALEGTMLDFIEGDIVKGIVRNVEKSGAFIDISYKSDGFLSNSEYDFNPANMLQENLKPGDDVDVCIDKLETKEGYVLVSRKRALVELGWNDLIRFSKSKQIIDVLVTSNVQGGLVVDYNGVKGFIPSSHLQVDNKDSMETLVNTCLSVHVLHVDRFRRKVIFSNRSVKSSAVLEDVQALIDGLEVGQTISGKVSSIKDFGAFIDIGGVEGLVHISELSWARVTHPSEVISVGQDVDVFVLGVDKKDQKISLGMKQLKPDPWIHVNEKYAVVNIVDGLITRVVPFGAFVQIEKDLEGLVHISEMANTHVNDINEYVTVGEKVKVKIIRLQPDEQKIGLSIKAIGAQSQSPSSSDQMDTVQEAPNSEKEAAEDLKSEGLSVEEEADLCVPTEN